MKKTGRTGQPMKVHLTMTLMAMAFTHLEPGTKKQVLGAVISLVFLDLIKPFGQ